MTRRTTDCPTCNRAIANNNYKRHIASCSGPVEPPVQKWTEHDGKFKCLACDFEGTKHGVVSHWNVMHTVGGAEKLKRARESHLEHTGGKAWNSGLTANDDPRIRQASLKIGKTLRESVANGTYISRKTSDDHRAFLSKRMSENNPGGRCKWYQFNGENLQGTWELNIAKVLHENNIPYHKVKSSLTYKDDDMKVRRYTPDIYLPSIDTYLEIKGFWWGNDKRKMELVIEQHKDMKIVILQKTEYERLILGHLDVIPGL